MPAPPRLKLTLRPAAETAVRSGHPWVWSDSIKTQNREGGAGELAVIYDRKDRFLAIGFHDPESPLRVRILHSGKPVAIDAAWWRERLAECVACRDGILDERTNGCRIINGDSEGWPGLVLDRYDRTYVLKLYSVAWLERIEMLRDLILTKLPTEHLILRLSRNIAGAAERAGWKDGDLLAGGDPGDSVPFLESGLHFEANVKHGQKTGFFLDQRENRRRVESLAAGAEVLNAFSFTGGFSLYAARGGATTVTDLDISAHALAESVRNFERNASDPRIAACKHRTVQADAFAWIEEAPAAGFDLVIVDPPSLAKRESEREGAIRAYGRLNANAIRLLKKGGTLVAASCSAHVSAEEFFGAVRNAAKGSGRRFDELETSGHAPDHPASFPEARYLKCLYLRFD